MPNHHAAAHAHAHAAARKLGATHDRHRVAINERLQAPDAHRLITLIEDGDTEAGADAHKTFLATSFAGYQTVVEACHAKGVTPDPSVQATRDALAQLCGMG